jgi:NAD(P)-dependent dehydrogenase (short-subunit alcohol dehydrogenase family)
MTVPISSVSDAFEVNVLGVLRVVKQFEPMLRDSQGRVVIMGSALGSVAVPLGVGYCSTKFALEGVADCLRMELRASGIPVSLIKPGGVHTPMYDKFQFTQQSDMKEEEVMARRAEKGRRIIPYLSIDPRFVSVAVTHAIMSAFPQSRYYVGLDSMLMSTVRPLCPDFVFDFVWSTLMGF